MSSSGEATKQPPNGDEPKKQQEQNEAKAEDAKAEEAKDEKAKAKAEDAKAKAEEAKAKDEKAKAKDEEAKDEEHDKARVQTDEEYENFLTKVLGNFDRYLQTFQAYMDSNTPEKATEQPRPIIEYLSWLCEFYGQMGKFKMTEKQLAGYRAKAGEKLAEYQPLIDSLCRCAVYLYHKHKEDAFVSQSPETETACEHERIYTALILGNFHNYTDCSQEFCASLAKAEFFFTDMVSDALTAWFDRHAAEGQTSARTVVNNLLGMTYNMFFKNNSQIYDALSRVKVVDAVKPYLKSPDIEVQLHALILIAFALDESQADLYLGAKEVMDFLVNHLRDSLGRPDRRSNGYHTIELAVCVNRLALNDVNKKLLMDTDLLPALLRMCQDLREDEMSAALDILFTLSFLPENRDRILAKFGEPLADLMADQTPRQDGRGKWHECRSLQGLDFNLNEQLSNPICSVGSSNFATGGSSNKKAAADDGDDNNGRPHTARQLRRHGTSDPEAVPACVLEGDHVMISYQHECKQTVCRIKEALTRAGIRVWIDYERMSEGSTLGAMADAVECSYAFVMCMSRKYKESNNCRVEAEYAWRLGKKVVPLLLETKYKPTGWLGIMLGLNLYYDFSGKYPFETKVPELLRVLSEARQAARGVSEPATVSAAPTAPERAESVRPLGTSRPSSAASVGSGSGGGSGREHHFPSAYQALPPINGSTGSAAPPPGVKARPSTTTTTTGGPRTVGLRAWSEAETLKWAEARGLADGMVALQSGGCLNGEALHFLADCKRAAPEAFYRLLERHLQCQGLREVAAFVNALDEL